MAKKNVQKKIAVENEIEVATASTPESAAIEHKLALLARVEGLPTKSAKIRLLAADGVSTSEIAKVLDIRYQHVRNVLTTQLKKGARA